jgi:hypothetical protein
MKRSLSHSLAAVIGVVLLSVGATAAMAEAPDFPAPSTLPPRGFILKSYEAPSYRSFARALDVVDAALAAHGVAGAATTPALVVSATGTQWFMGNHSRPWENKIVPSRKRWVFSGAAGSAAYDETMFNPIGGRFNARTVIAGGKGLAKGFFEPASQELSGPALDAALLPLEEALPHLLLLQAKRFRLTLRDAGAWADSTGPYDVVTFASGPTRTITLFIHQSSHLLTRVEKLGYTPEYGDVVGVCTFGNFHAVAGIQVPGRRHDERLGKTEFDLDLVVQAATTEDLAAFTALGPVPGARPAADPLQGVEIREIAAGVQAVVLADRGVKSFVVERSDHLVVIETPFDAKSAAAILAAARQIAPGKPVRYVAFSHEHRHTASGVPAFLREGATLIGTAETVAFAEDLARLQHRGAPDGLPPPPPPPPIPHRLVTGRLDLPDDANPLVVYNAGATSQTDPSTVADGSFTRADYLLVYLPKSGLLLNGCLSSFHEGEEPVGSDRQEALLATLHTLGVSPRLLCSAMETDDRLTVPLDDLTAAVAKRRRLKPLTDELEACATPRLVADAGPLAERCRQEGLGPEWFGGKAEGILLRDPERAKAWAALTTLAWPAAPQGWQCLSEADEALGQIPDALSAARKAAALDTKNEDLSDRVLRLEKLGAPK